MTENQRQQMAWFRNAQWAYRYQDPKIQAAFAEATEGTPFMPRDLFTQMLAGRFCFIRQTDGRILPNMASIQDVSQSLDVLGDTPGLTLVRGPTRWQAALNPASGLSQCTAKRTNTFNIAAGQNLINWQATLFDDAGYWDIANPSRLTVPSNAVRAQIALQVRTTGTSTTNCAIRIFRNETDVIAQQNYPSGFTNTADNCVSPWLPVTAGDYFTATVEYSNTSSRVFQFDMSAMSISCIL